MLKRVMWLSLLALVGTGISTAQLCTTSHQTDLYCLIPAAFHTTSNPFNAFYTPFGTELSQLPTARPAGLILGYDNGVLKPTNENLGAIFTERSDVLGRHRVFLGFTYQRFGFTSIDGNGLRNLPIILTCYLTAGNQCLPASTSDTNTVYTISQDRIDLKANQYVILGAIGITNRIDVSVSIPFEWVSMSAAVNATEFNVDNGASAKFNEYVPGSSSGIGDVVIGGKGSLFKGEKFRLAAGVDIRVPSGDELNFLGSGTVGVSPYLAASYHGRISPRANIGYQWNGDSILNATARGTKQQLPTDFFYTFGAQISAFRRLDFIADLLGQHFFDAPRLSSPKPFPIQNFGSPLTMEPFTGSYTTNNLSLGVKGVPFRHFVLTGNVLVKLDNGGLRAKIAPLAGISYSF